MVSPSSPNWEENLRGLKILAVSLAGGFCKSFGIGLRCDVVTTSPVGTLKVSIAC